MKQLNAQDWRNLNSAIAQLNSDFHRKSLSRRALESAAIIVPAECNSFDFFDGADQYNGTAWSNREDLVTPENMQIFTRYVHQHPAIPIALGGKKGGAVKITDVVSQSEFEKTELYNEFYRLVQFKRQMGVALPIFSELTVCCVITREKKDFSPRDKLILTLFAPHLINSIRNHIAYERLSRALEIEMCGVIALDCAGKPIFISAYADQLLDKYFTGEKRRINRFPHTLAAWLRQISLCEKADDLKLPPKSLKIENQHGSLTVRLMFNSTTQERILLLEEKRLPNVRLFEHFHLTRREAEILFWVTQGKTNEVISQLCGISERTVHKHVQHIYAKLGVETRTAAMRMVFEML